MNKGDYVRTKDGYITKIDSYTCWEAKNQYYISYTLPNGCECASTVTNKFKISPNIIDLIEVGDYVNGYKVVKVGDFGAYDNRIGSKYIRLDFNTENDDLHWGDFEEIQEPDIKSIVTKEQFKQMEYKVGKDER